MRTGISTVLVLLLATAASAADRITKEQFGSGGRTRTYYSYVPDSVREEQPAPLIVFLHGSGRNGLSLVEKWKGLASKEGIILAGPDALNKQGWFTTDDGPDLLHDLVDIVSAQHPVDPRRVYVFGHSAGAIHGLMLGLLESQYFAAVAVHAGALSPDAYAYADAAPRKIPMAIWIGTQDAFFPLETVRATRDALVQSGFTVQFTEMAFHTHDYYTRSAAINKEAWAFLKAQALPADPVFTRYEVRR